MMHLSFRTRQNLHRIFSLVIGIVISLLIVTLCLVIWMGRFVVYTDNGVELDFDRSYNDTPQLPGEPDELPSITISYEDSAYVASLQQLSGYYVSEEDLMTDPEAVQAKLAELPAGTAVMLDIKGYRGYFFYHSSVGGHTSGMYNIDKMDALLQWLADSELYVIARMSSLRDFVLVWDDSSYGLTTASGGLYSDSGNYGIGYWLDPTKPAVQNYLVAVINELKNMGMDEVVLYNFRYPDYENLAFTGDRSEALLQCAEKLVSSCATDGFVVSFATDDPTFQLPEGRCRLYLQDIAAEDAQTAWNTAAVEEKRLHLVFVAPNTDNRYHIENGVLRPLI